MRTKDEIIGFTKSLRVLIVEDTAVDRRLLESMLSESSGVTSFLRSADSFKKAIVLLEKHNFEVVVLDLNLPDSQGIETLYALREKYPDVAVVVNTGAYEDDLGIQTLSSGAQDFLVKGKYNAYFLNKVLHYALERKRVEKVLENAYAQLKETQDQLIQSEKFKVVGTLATGVAHEVKNPLATILYGITFLSEHLKNKDEKTVTVLTTVKDAVNHANKVIVNLLDLSSGTYLKKAKQNLHESIDKAVSLTRYQLEQKHISLHKEFELDIPNLEIDSTKIEQVIINLILNAGHSMADGGMLTIRTESSILSDDFKKYPRLFTSSIIKRGQKIVLLEIEDNGCGILKEKIKNIFDPFFTSRRATGGVGLGLSVSKNIIDLHNGEIFMENISPQGAKAVIILPIE
ncbi:hypothetical protein MNBD_UNCLBAC01-717 [hydrothermal vent metagenome]|uniref:Histidine kinase n=1 Tax=hydrothermal vent metagenome TaxID=652676 RepID=A0A3B1CWE9_9ZZZZ